jgi:hypothetical protein
MKQEMKIIQSSSTAPDQQPKTQHPQLSLPFQAIHFFKQTKTITKKIPFAQKTAICTHALNTFSLVD